LNQNSSFITSDDPAYSSLLNKIYDPPKELHFKGDIGLLNSRSIAIVGTRKATRYGRETAKKLAFDLSKAGFTIVSGLAEGIDTEAHIGALEANGKTIAVFGNGIDLIFPADNKELAKKIEDSGLCVSEYPGEFPGTKWTFPRRNRMISGLSLGVIVVEGHYDSGAMITAKLALEEGREVFAVPGSINEEQTKGPHWLIKQGAKLIESADDVLEEFNIENVSHNISVKKADFSQLSLEESKIVQQLSNIEVHIDDISAKAGMQAAQVLGILSVLEIKGIVKQMPGKYFVIS
jgi:DNA processing protein